MPPAVKKLPEHQQRIWMAAFNAAYTQYKGDEQKAFAVAWAAANKQKEALHPDFQRIFKLFQKRYGTDAELKFEMFLSSNGLNPEKPYRPETQLKESFEWVEPIIRFYKQDKEAKYYLVRALTANISMNNNDYSDYDEMQSASKSMNWRPLNINHSHGNWQPFPRTRADYAKADDFSVEATLRIDNTESFLQKQLDHDPSIDEKRWINHVSIEGRPDADGEGYHFTGLALLEKGYELPGDPLTEIVPLVFNESVGKSLCEFKDGKMVCGCTLQEEVKKELSKTSKELIEKMSPEDCIAKIKELQTQYNEVNTKLYPSSKLTEEQRKELCTQQSNLLTEMNLYKTALASMLQMNPTVPTCQKCESLKDIPKETSDLRLKCASLELENHTLKTEAKQAQNERENEKAESKRLFDTQKEQAERIHLEDKQLIEQLTKTKYTYEGTISEKNSQISKLEEHEKTLINEIGGKDKLILEKEGAIAKKQTLLEEAYSARDSYKELHEKLRVSYEQITKSHKENLEENLRLTNELTEAKAKELSAIKEKTALQESISKATRFQKWAYTELKKHGVEIVQPQT